MPLFMQHTHALPCLPLAFLCHAHKAMPSMSAVCCGVGLASPVFIYAKIQKANQRGKQNRLFLPVLRKCCMVITFISLHNPWWHPPCVVFSASLLQMLSVMRHFGGVKWHLSVAKWLFASAKVPLFQTAQYAMPHICAVWGCSITCAVVFFVACCLHTRWSCICRWVQVLSLSVAWCRACDMCIGYIIMYMPCKKASVLCIMIV